MPGKRRKRHANGGGGHRVTEDFHNLFGALKKVLKGKWVMSGVSKGGITTLLQHTFYPNDMDIYVPYSAPFFRRQLLIKRGEKTYTVTGQLIE